MKLLNPVRSAKLKRYPNGNIYQGFGENPALYQPFGLRYHNGIDIATFDGDEILAAHDGVVTDVRINSQGYGNSVLLLSDKVDGKYILTRYSHLRIDIPVIAGQQVKVGDVIGCESNTGFVVSGSTPYWGNAPAGKGVHLHFGVCPLKDVEPNTYQYYFPSINKTLTAINGDNGVHGYEDPLPYFTNTMYRLIKRAGDEDTYFIDDLGKRVQIGDWNTFEAFSGKLWGDVNSIETVTDEIFNSYLKGGIIVKTRSI